MVSLLSLIAFLIIRVYYKDLYKILFYVSFPALLLMVLITASGDLAGAESIGNIVFILLILLNVEAIFARYLDKTKVKTVVKASPKKKKR